MSTTHAEFYRGLELASQALAGGSTDPVDQAAAVHRTIQPHLDDTPAAHGLACRRGCSHCCHFPVGVTFPEAMRIAQVITDRPELRETLRAAHTTTADKTWEQLVAVPCPMLRDDACAIHEARPMPCRALGSSDAQACEDSLTAAATPPRDETAWWRGLGAAAALAEGSPGGTRELRSAVNNILTDRDSPEVAFTNARRAPGA